jgi:hypothetical protein
MPERSRFVALLVVLLIAAGAWRLFAVVGATPLLGYANQFDMRRTSACIGLWPELPPPAQLEAHPQAPLARYVRGERRRDECYPSSELLFVAPVAAIVSPGEVIDLRRIGAVKAVLLVALALLLAALLRAQATWSIAHAVLFAIVVCDPMNALWLNTLYTEFAAVFFLYASLVLIVVIAGRETLSSAPPATILVAFAVALCGLGFSRQQHMLLPAVLALPVVMSLWRPALRSALAILVLVPAIASAQALLIGRHPAIAAANNADVVLGAILPASLDPELTAQRLGLPERCLQSAGATWYVTMGEPLQSSCPEALSVPRARQALLLLSEPSTLARAFIRGLPQFQDWRLGYMGVVEGHEYAGVESAQAIAGGAGFSPSSRLTAFEPAVFVLALTASLVLLAISTIGVIVSAAIERRAPLALVLYALTASAWYAFATAIFGDGYVETARHAQAAATCLYAVAVMLFISLFAPLLIPLGAGVRTAIIAPIASVLFALVSVAAAALLQPVLRTAMVAMPMAIGVVDRPQQNAVAPGPVELAGWALDPFGVSGVAVVTDSGEVFEAARNLPYVGARSEPLALYYPSYPQVANPGFVVELPARVLAQGVVGIRTLVFNVAGGRTEIDRRRLVAAPR